MRHLLLAAALGNAFVVQGFVPHSVDPLRVAKPATTTAETVLLAQPKEQEKNLRQALAERTSKLENEQQYAVRDGPLVDGDELEEEEETLPADPEKESESERLVRRMSRLTKRRAYPLFLAEKAAELVENVLPKNPVYPEKRERIVVLGTGWGAVSFLKGIDTSLYDVTVISPRNYFLFTPMLGTNFYVHLRSQWVFLCPVHTHRFFLFLLQLERVWGPWTIDPSRNLCER